MIFPGNLPQTLCVGGVVLALQLASISPLAAQSKGEKPGEPAASEQPAPSNAPYMKPLGRLATLLGSMHFLRALCGDPNADVWRQKMSELLEAQSPGEADRRILVANFNQGYRAFESTYRQCTPAATVAIERYRKEGATLSREISARYGS